ncbi:glycoside hydrolase family 3 N-terminal domain-containing protein [Candidatus Avelusimicrobium sp.]|uniref:glycoside hydrolase family 3 N-terminal domain-containing protein n=1 Tax=Candidatus Avelusimicrobium sp. TaxID=3048833 RepID=UPI003D7DEE50
MKINRLVHPGFWFGKTNPEDALKLARLGVGGFCLYGGTRKQVAELIRALREASPLKKILISADYEDGLGRWLPDAELLPSNLALGAANEEDLAFEKGFLTACQAKSLGVDWVFAPVLDLADCPQNPIVNTRSFGADPQLVSRLARAFIKGLAQGGALNSIKHFPGHGNTSTDSHMAMPTVPSPAEHLQTHELVPFKNLLPLADSVMVGHLLVPALDEESPASLSAKIVSGLLKTKLGYKGCVVTDALCMKALGDEKQAALAAFLAGAHILLVPENPFELLEFLHQVPLDKTLLAEAEHQQDSLCERADIIPAHPEEETFQPTDFATRAAQKALTWLGPKVSLRPGQTVQVVEVGNDENLSSEPFINALRQGGVTVVNPGERADKLVVLCWRRYQAFKGKIALDPAEINRVQTALKQYPAHLVIALANPWAAKQLNAQSTLFTFSPAPSFQRTAAECLLGKFEPQGHLPVTL